ncbi:2,5-diamino-6-(ribosylamino)-4(3H)-pyrimidinone 5'-phosphate reductase, partial [Methanosphaera stadtmanae]
TLRKEYDGIMVGINTVLIDNPKLTIHKINCKKSENPTRIIVDSSARIPLDSKVLNDDAKTIVIVSSKANKASVELLKEKCNVIICGSKQVNLKLALDKLYSLGIKSILLEGGSTLNFSMFKEKLIDEVSICIGSKILGGYDSKTFVDGEGFDKNDCINLKIKKVEKIDDDILLKYDVIY